MWGHKLLKPKSHFVFPLCTKRQTNGPSFPLEFSLSRFFSFPLTGGGAVLMDSNMLCSYSGPLNNADLRYGGLEVPNLQVVKNPSYN